MSVEDNQEDPLFPLYAPALEAKYPHSAISAILKSLATQGYDHQTLNQILRQFQSKYRVMGVEYQEDAFFPLYTAAFKSPYPYTPLRETVEGLLEQGHDRKVLIESLTQFMLMLRLHGTEEQEDVVLDLLDALTGWCHPDAQL